MDFKSLISQLDQLNESAGKTVHKGTYGTSHGKEDVRDQYGHKIGKVNKDAETDKEAPKKGRGRPKKGADETGEVKKYDFSAFGVTKGKDVKLPKYDKKKTKKHSIKEYLDQMYEPLNEQGITVKPMPGASQIIGANGKPMGTADAATANTIKQASEKGTLKLGGDEEMQEGTVSDHPENQAMIQKLFATVPGLMDVWKKYKHLSQYGTSVPANMAALKKEFPNMDRKTMQDIADSLILDNDPYSSSSGKAAFYAAKQIKDYLARTQQVNEKDLGKHNNATTGFAALAKKTNPKIAGAQLAKMRAKGQVEEADQPPRDALASPLTLEAKKAKPDFLDMDKDGNKKETMKKAVSDKKKVKEGMDQKLNAARSEGKAHGLRGHAHCGKNYEDMEEARCYHEGYKEGLDECYGQVPIQGYVGETTPVVNTMASYGAEEGELAEADIEESPFSWAAKNTPKGDKFSLGGKEFVKNDAFAFEALDKQLNALLESKEDVAEGMTVSISKGQQGSPDSVSVSAQDGEADQLLSVIKSAGLGLFGGDDSPGMSHAEPMTVDNNGEPSEVGAGGDAIEVVGDHDGMMNLMKKLSGIGGGEQPNSGHSHDEESEETCESCGGMMEAGHSCGEGQEMVDEVESEDEMTDQVAEDNPPDSGAAEVDAEDNSVNAANAAAAAYNPSQDVDEGSEANDVGNIGVEAGDAEEEMQASMNEEDEDQKQKDGLEESSFFNLYKKLAMLSEESTAEKDDKAEKAAKKVAKDIEYDEGHKGKDDDKAEKAGKEVKKDIEYDDKKDKKEKKLDEWANDAGPGKSVSDTTFETDIDFMMNVISGGLNKRKQTGQTTIPVIASQLGRQVSRNTTGINESVDDSDAVAQWKKLAGLK